MNTRLQLLILSAISICGSLFCAQAQKIEKVKYGDFENWVVRNIEESAVLGGKVKTIYNIAPTDTISKNTAFDYRKTPWTTSNAYAVVAGVTKTSCSVYPDMGPTGRCARLETDYVTCKVAGLLNIRLVVAGAMLWGRTKEPIRDAYDPYGTMDWGIAFDRRPEAVILDYKAVIPHEGVITRSDMFKHTTYSGDDPARVMLLLQRRWEDEQGNIHAERVGTAVYLIDRSSNGWVRDRSIPVIYGDARKDPSYQPCMDLLSVSGPPMTSTNSRGKSKIILEESWADADAPVTHAILFITSSSQQAFRGALGNKLWVDNIRLQYE